MINSVVDIQNIGHPRIDWGTAEFGLSGSAESELFLINIFAINPELQPFIIPRVDFEELEFESESFVWKNLEGSSGSGFGTKFGIPSEELNFSTGRERRLIFKDISWNPIL